jgi:hypothetical protein
VILEIPGLIRELVPGLLDGGHVSVACVRTTRPKYLVFGVDADRPACVVQFGAVEAMEREHRALSLLHPVLPDLVAAPLACVVWRGSLSVQVQSGLSGLPWFRLADRVRSAREWNSLGRRAIATLARFHQAVREVAEWTGSVQPGMELRRQATICEMHDTGLSARARDCIDEAAEQLDDLGTRRHFWQHGDYCLNNLLVSRSGLAVIDFEEFGGTLMPWHDEIGLALSVNDLSCYGAPSLADALGAIPMPEHPDWPRPSTGYWFRGFVLHHLLWRINQAAVRPSRARIQASLAEAIEWIAATPLGSQFARATF